MSKELLELSELYSQIAEQGGASLPSDYKKTEKAAIELANSSKDKEENKKEGGIKIKREGGGYTIIYPGNPNYEKAKSGELTTIGSGESRGVVTKNNETGELTSKSEIKSGANTEVKPEVKTDVKPEVKTEVKPEKKDYRTDAQIKLDKMPKMSKLERQNRLRFGNDEIDRLKQKQIDFRTWKANSQLPGADRKQLKLDFMNKYPNSITTQQHYGLRDHYDVEGQSLSEQGKKVVDANAVPAEDAQKPKTDGGESSIATPKKKVQAAPTKPNSPNVKVNPEIKESRKTYCEGLDAYDSVLAYLMATNQVDTIEEANYVMMEMDGKTIYDIRQLTEGMPSYVRDSIGRQYGTGKYRGQKYTIEDKKNVINWYAGNIPQV